MEIIDLARTLHIRSRYVFSPHKIGKIQPRKQVIWIKPRGLWYSWGGQWVLMLWEHHQKWPEDGWRLDWLKKIRYIYKIKLDYSKILRPTNLKAFTEKYGDSEYIDWKKVAEEYSGIDIRYRSHWDKEDTWYDGWDVSSGCVWNPDGVLSMRVWRNKVDALA